MTHQAVTITDMVDLLKLNTAIDACRRTAHRPPCPFGRYRACGTRPTVEVMSQGPEATAAKQEDPPTYPSGGAPKYMRTRKQLIEDYGLRPTGPVRGYVQSQYGDVALYQFNETEIIEPDG